MAERKSLWKHVCENPPAGWEELFTFAEPEIKNCDAKLKDMKYLPFTEDVFRIFYMMKPADIKVVILGQDPYHTVINGVPQACGIAFATRPDTKTQPSVNNIYKVCAATVENFEIPSNGYFTGWIKQGVFPLNVTLTTMKGEPNEHQGLWAGFIKKFFQFIKKKNEGMVFLLWGAFAQKYSRECGSTNTKLLASHPSGFSFARGNGDVPAFRDCNHFNLANEHLQKAKKNPIDWTKVTEEN